MDAPRRRAVVIVVVAGLLAGLALALRPRPAGPPYAEARAVIDKHCLGCHSEHPSIPAFPLPPKDVKLDTAEEMRLYAALIKKTVLETRTMPLVDVAGMTEAERTVLGAWVDAGARPR